MVGVHSLIGLGEAIITTGAIALLQVTRPEVLVVGETAPGRKRASFLAIGLIVALIVAIFSPLASPSPDGLEFVAEAEGFLSRSLDPLYELLPDYTVPFIADETSTTILAVFFGTLIVFGIAWIVGRTTFRREAAGN